MAVLGIELPDFWLFFPTLCPIMAEYPREVFQKLIKMIAEKANEPLDMVGFENMQQAIDGTFGERFLYRKHKLTLDATVDMISINRTKFELLLKYVGFNSYDAYIDALANPISETLKSCEGVWLCYVRQNSDKGIVYQSPVRIYEQQGEMHFHLSGPHQPYKGVVSFNDGTIYVLFRGENGKQFHHVYKLGKRIGANVLQGVFSGISTVGEPIGGRTVLIRSDREFDALANHGKFNLGYSWPQIGAKLGPKLG